MTKWGDPIQDLVREGQVKYIGERWRQLSELELAFSNDAVRFLFLSNAGASVASLTFIGTAESVRSQNWAWLMLIFFALGVISVGIVHAIRYHRISNLFKSWRDSVLTYYSSGVCYEDIIIADSKKSEKFSFALVFSYSSFAFLILGIVVGGVNYKNLGVKENHEQQEKKQSSQPSQSSSSFILKRTFSETIQEKHK